MYSKIRLQDRGALIDELVGQRSSNDASISPITLNTDVKQQSNVQVFKWMT
jgi:hypothetical protein